MRNKTAYNRYVKSEHWRETRKSFIDFLFKQGRARCFDCKAPYDKGFHVHHKTYKNIGAEDFGELSLLCPTCHSFRHKYGRRRINKKKKPPKSRQVWSWEKYFKTGDGKTREKIPQNT